MNTETNRLLNLTYEIEGLLLLADKRGNDTPDRIWQIIAEKSEAIIHTAKLCQQELNFAADTPTPDVEDHNNANTETGKIQDFSATFPCDDIYNIDELEIKPDTTTNSNTTNQEEIHDSNNIIPQDQHDTTKTAIESQNVDFLEETCADSQNHNEKPVNEIESQNENPYPAGIYDDQPITLDEKLAREQSRCLRKAFSLNDRFRFRRELFGNSDTEFADALNMLEAMETLSEANEYFYDDLQWDPENPEVIDFMQIVTKHFQGK